ncbi:ribbon-helix-helix domain-containing protein [Pseudomonas phoenicis]|uniref:ribbon-helix-helix domain-containing protein n=1 Tax=unclassified Pseudomonas TaxID=196821 RepID=UPI0039A2A767
MVSRQAPMQRGWPGKQCIDPFAEDFDMRSACPVSRSVRLNGFSTCLRLERVYWGILDRIAEANRCSVSAVLSYLDREVHLRHGGVRNFSGLVRVVCVAWLLDPPDARRATSEARRPMNGELHGTP